MNHVLQTTAVLCVRELTHFIRQRNRLIGAFLQPLLFWVLIGTGMNPTFQSPVDGFSYMDFFFTGIVLMILLFTSIFATMSIIDDRNSGFLQGVLASPAPRIGIVLGKAAGGTTMGTAQALLLLPLVWTPFLSLELSAGGALWLLVMLVWTSFFLTVLGVVIAWGVDSSQGYHAIMSVVLFPLWIFSGAAFPTEGVPGWLHALMQINPLTHALALIRSGFAGFAAPSPVSISYLAILTVVLLLMACSMVSRKEA